MSEKTKAELLKEELFYKNDNGLMTKSQDEIKKAFDFCDAYTFGRDNFIKSNSRSNGCRNV